MIRDAQDNVTVTESEWNSDPRGYIHLAFSENVGLCVIYENGDVVWSAPRKKLPSPEEIREQLKAEAALFEAVDALEAHERKAGGA